MRRRSGPERPSVPRWVLAYDATGPDGWDGREEWRRAAVRWGDENGYGRLELLRLQRRAQYGGGKW